MTILPLFRSKSVIFWTPFFFSWIGRIWWSFFSLFRSKSVNVWLPFYLDGRIWWSFSSPFHASRPISDPRHLLERKNLMTFFPLFSDAIWSFSNHLLLFLDKTNLMTFFSPFRLKSIIFWPLSPSPGQEKSDDLLPLFFDASRSFVTLSSSSPGRKNRWPFSSLSSGASRS